MHQVSLHGFRRPPGLRKPAPERLEEFPLHVLMAHVWSSLSTVVPSTLSDHVLRHSTVTCPLLIRLLSTVLQLDANKEPVML